MKTTLAIVTTWFALLASEVSLYAVQMMVNEYRNGSGNQTNKMGQNDFIEFVILENATSSQLSALTFGDTNDFGDNLRGVFRFDQATLNTALTGAGLSSFQAGTIIVVKGTGLGTQDLNYGPLSTTPSDHNAWSIQLVAGQGALDHPETTINGNIDLAPPGDVVWISTSNPPATSQDTSGFIHAIGNSANSSLGVIGDAVVAQFGTNNMLVSSLATNRSLSNLWDTNESLAVTSTPTMGNPNGGTNNAWIEFIRANGGVAVPEPSRLCFIGMGLLFIFTRRRRHV
jgi:hypothetical protein